MKAYQPRPLPAGFSVTPHASVVRCDACGLRVLRPGAHRHVCRVRGERRGGVQPHPELAEGGEKCGA